MSEIRLIAPLDGWCTPLAEVPDEVFAKGMMGDGLAIDPTGAVLCAPCGGELTAIPDTAHAVNLQTTEGVEILLHVGIDTVELRGLGFQALARAGERVKAGQPLIRFDLELLARRAASLVTPVLVANAEQFPIVERHAAGVVRAGEHLMTLRAGAVTIGAPPADAAAATVRGLRISLPHGLHARPAARLAQSLRGLNTEVSFSLRGRTANARSAVAILALGARHDDEISVRATGADAAAAFDALALALRQSASAAAPVSAPAKLGTANRARPATPPGTLTGSVAAPGLAIGRAHRLRRPEPVVQEQGADPAAERRALDRARGAVRRRLASDAQSADRTRAEIAGAHLEFLDDPELLTAAQAAIAAGKSAGHAWRTAIRASLRALESSGDDYLAARADDLRDLETQLLEALPGRGAAARIELPAASIVIAEDLLPSQLMALDASRLAGICTVSRGTTSHVAILAAAMNLPMLAGMEATLLAIPDGTPLALDAESGSLAIDPAPEAAAKFRGRIAAGADRREGLRRSAQQEGRTADGERIQVYANVVSAADAESAVASGAEGCGLLRTEFLFLDRREPPDEDEQRAHYQRIVDAFAGRPVVIRTLDAGSDKPIPFLPIPPQDNPALGLRGIRVSLMQPALLAAQLRAVLGVRPAGSCRILLPMVNDLAEIRAVRRLLDEVRDAAGIAARIPLGVMIETPAAAVGTAGLAREADFFSIGTNDLAQYTLAIDRTHPELGAALDALHPAVLRLIGEVAAAARAADRPVAVCGGLASDPVAVPVLVGLGIHELSVVPASIPLVKAAVKRLSLDECRELAQRALGQESAQAVRALLAGSATR